MPANAGPLWTATLWLLDLASDCLWSWGDRLFSASLHVGGVALRIAEQFDPVGVEWRRQQLERALQCSDVLHGMDGPRFTGTVLAERHMLFQRRDAVSLYAVQDDQGRVFIRTDDELAT